MQKTIQDYLPQLYEEYSDLDKRDVSRAVRFGWRAVASYIRKGLDLKFQSHFLFLYAGTVYRSQLKQFFHYVKQLRKKLYLYVNSSIYEWDGYYYFYVPNPTRRAEFEKLFERKRRWYPIKTVKLYRFFEQCRLQGRLQTTFYRVKLPYQSHVVYRRNFRMEGVELYKKYDRCMNFKDLLEFRANSKILKRHGCLGINKHFSKGYQFRRQ